MVVCLLCRSSQPVSPVSSAVVSPKPESSESPKKAKSRKNEAANGSGGCVSPRPTARYPNPSPTPHAANCQIKASRKMVSSTGHPLMAWGSTQALV